MNQYNGYFLITDLDGTLLNSDKVISAENKEAIQTFVNQGGRFSVATGRSPASAGRWLEQLPINYPCVFYNGSMVKDLKSDQVWDCAYLDKSKFQPLVNWGLEQIPTTVVEIFTQQGLYVISDPQMKDPYLEGEKDPYFQAEPEVVEELEWIKILLCDNHANLVKIEERLKEHHLDKSCNSFYSQDFFFEITPKDHSKGTALRLIREKSEEKALKIIASGDYDNDEEMIVEADFGVAVGNAQECLKMAADYIASDNNHYPMADILREVTKRFLSL